MNTASRKKPILCLDFDGVIHAYTSPWTNAETISDGPVPGALRWIWKATEWFEVVIYSSRSKELAGRDAMYRWMMEESRKEFGLDHPMGVLVALCDYPVTFAHEKPAAFLTIDDRAICFEGNWDELEPADLLEFKPWNKRPPQPKLGATGRYPQGVLNDNDEGELQIGIARDPLDGLVHLNFGKPIAWTAMPPKQAEQLAVMLLKHAGAKTVQIEYPDEKK